MKKQLKFWIELARNGKGWRVVDCSTDKDNLGSGSSSDDAPTFVRGTATYEVPPEKKAKAKK